MKGRCLDEGILMAYVDDELNFKEMKEIEEHIEDCSNCREKLQEIKATKTFTTQKLSRIIESDKVKMPSYMKKFWQNKVLPRVAAVAAGILILIGAPVLADKLYTFFRAEKIEVVAVNAEDLEKLSNLFHQIGESKIEGIIEVKTEQIAKGRELSEKELEKIPSEVNPGLVNLPEALKKSVKLTTAGQQQGLKITVKANIEGLNQQLKFLGAKKLFPKTLDGKEFTLSLKPTYYTEYQWKGGGYIHITRITTPEIKTEARVSPAEIAEVLLESPGFPAELRNSLAGITGELDNTLVLPVSKNVNVEDVSVAGISGKLFQDNGYNTKFLVFLKDGVITIIYSSLDRDTLLEVARGLSW